MKLETASKFTYQLGAGLKAGADLIKLLQVESSLGSSKHRASISELLRGSKAGQSLSDIMEGHSYFPRVMTSVVRVGEETGKIESALLTLSRHYEHRIATRRAFLSAIAWPILQLIAGIMIVSLMIYLLGILTAGGGGAMPDILGFGLRGPSGVLWFWLYLSIFFGILTAILVAFIKNIAGYKTIPLVYKIPGAGSSIQTITITGLCWTLALSLGAGLDPIKAIALALDSTDSDYYREGSKKAELAIRGGASLSEGLRATEVLPDDFIQRVDIAEVAGVDAESSPTLLKSMTKDQSKPLRY